PRRPPLPEEAHVPPARAIGPHDLRPPSVGLASGRRPPDTRGRTSSVACGRSPRGTPRPHNCRHLLETRKVPSGTPGDGPRVAVSPGGESRELWKAVRPVLR